MKRPPGEATGTVKRVVEVLRFFAERGEATLKEMSIALGLAPSTCHRLIELLGREGLIEQDSTHRRYRVGVEMFRISAQVQSRNDIRSIAVPFLRELAAACDETCVLSIYLPVEGKIFFAERADSSRALRYQVAMNVPVSVLWGASGRSILAFLDPATVDRIYRAEGRAPGSGEALPSRRALDKDLAAIRNAMPFANPDHQPIHMAGTLIGAALKFCHDNMILEATEGDRLIILVSDGASSDLGAGQENEIAELLTKEFPSATIVAVGRTALFDDFFQRVMHVEETAAADAAAEQPVATAD